RGLPAWNSSGRGSKHWSWDASEGAARPRLSSTGSGSQIHFRRCRSDEPRSRNGNGASRSVTMKIVIFGLSITSSWGNGHATTFRALTSALEKRGHEIVFFERDVEWYASNRDMPEPPFCQVVLYQTWTEALPQVRKELRDCDVAMVGSYCPDGVAAIDAMFESPAAVKTFYDIDTPITVAKLRVGDVEYLRRRQVPGFDV